MGHRAHHSCAGGLLGLVLRRDELRHGVPAFAGLFLCRRGRHHCRGQPGGHSVSAALRRPCAARRQRACGGAGHGACAGCPGGRPVPCERAGAGVRGAYCFDVRPFVHHAGAAERHCHGAFERRPPAGFWLCPRHGQFWLCGLLLGGGGFHRRARRGRNAPGAPCASGRPGAKPAAASRGKRAGGAPHGTPGTGAAGCAEKRQGLSAGAGKLHWAVYGL